MTNINHSMAAKNNAMVLKCAPTTWSVWRSVRVLVLVLVLFRMGWVFFFVFGFFFGAPGGIRREASRAIR